MASLGGQRKRGRDEGRRVTEERKGGGEGRMEGRRGGRRGKNGREERRDWEREGKEKGEGVRREKKGK